MKNFRITSEDIKILERNKIFPKYYLLLLILIKCYYLLTYLLAYLLTFLRTYLLTCLLTEVTNPVCQDMSNHIIYSLFINCFQFEVFLQSIKPIEQKQFGRSVLLRKRSSIIYWCMENHLRFCQSPCKMTVQKSSNFHKLALAISTSTLILLAILLHPMTAGGMEDFQIHVLKQP